MAPTAITDYRHPKTDLVRATEHEAVAKKSALGEAMAAKLVDQMNDFFYRT